jgi:type IV secretory pathway TrbL component
VVAACGGVKKMAAKAKTAIIGENGEKAKRIIESGGNETSKSSGSVDENKKTASITSGVSEMA